MTRALIYTRVSQDRAGGRSPAEQEAESRTVCEREGWEVTEVVTDSAGASRYSKGKRPGWERTLGLLASGDVDVLVTWESSRAQRDLAAFAKLRDLCYKHGVLWSYKGRTRDLSNNGDRFETGLDALMAEREAGDISERVCRAMRASAAKGRPPGRRLFGYERTYDETSGLLTGQRPHPTEAPIVQRIYDDYLAGAGIRTIARRLNEAGATTGSGAEWTDVQVRRVLTNPAYIAQRVHRGEVVGDADWPALVDPATFDRAAARLAAMNEGKTRQVKTARLLTGVGRCGVCGGKIKALHDRRGRKFYQCQGKFHVARDLRKLDAFVTVAVLERLARPDVAAALGDSEPAEVAEARQQVTELRGRLDAAVAEYSAGRLTAATLGRVESDLLAKIAEAERAVVGALVPLEVDVPPAGVDEWWNGLDAEMRREVVGALIGAVVILPTKKGTRDFDPDAVRIEWRGWPLVC